MTDRDKCPGLEPVMLMKRRPARIKAKAQVRLEPDIENLVRAAALESGRKIQTEVNRALFLYFAGKPTPTAFFKKLSKSV